MNTIKQINSTTILLNNITYTLINNINNYNTYIKYNNKHYSQHKLD